MRALILILAFASCTQFPELDATATPGVAEADFPALLPLDALLRGPLPRATPDLRASVVSRAGSLQSRAARLRGPVIDRATRARMARGVTARDITNP